MNPAIHAAIAASHKQEQGVDGLVRKLHGARAVSASSATALPDYDSKAVDEAIGLGLVIRSSDGRLHVNERAVTDRHQSHGWTVIVVLLVGASVAASILALLAN